MDIPIPDNYKPRKPSNGDGHQRYRPKECYAKKVSIDLQQEHQEKVYSVYPVNFLHPVCPPYFPVCPVLKKMISEEKHYRLPDIPKTNLPLLDSLIKILVVFESLMQLKPNRETVVRLAHSENLLKERLDLIRKDLLALPQWLEKDFPETSKECKELIAEIQFDEMRYVMHGSSLVYLLPDNLEFGNWATFLRWREQQGNYAKLQGFSTEIEMSRLTRHYPAEAIKVMREMHGKLSPLVLKILPEQALVKNQSNSYIKQLIENLNNKPMKKENGGGETGDRKSDQNSKSKEQIWDDNNHDYEYNSKVIQNLSDDLQITLATLSKLLKPDGQIRYMRKHRRCKVHVAELVSYLSAQKRRDNFSEETFEAMEKRKANIRKQSLE